MSLELTIVTPQGEAFHGPIESVVLPGSEGDFGVLPRHERLLTALRDGEVEIRTAAGTRTRDDLRRLRRRERERGRGDGDVLRVRRRRQALSFTRFARVALSFALPSSIATRNEKAASPKRPRSCSRCFSRMPSSFAGVSPFTS